MRRLCILVSLSAGMLSATAAVAQDQQPLSLDLSAAQQRLMARSDAIEAGEANVRGKEAQEGATRSLRRPDVDVEAQLLEYQKTLYLPLGSLAPVAEGFGIDDPLTFRQRRTAVRPIVTTTLPLYAGGQIGATQAGARAQVAQAKAERDTGVENGLLQLIQYYFGQQLAERVVVVRRDVLAGLDRHVADTVKLERGGFATKAQRLQAVVARDNAANEYDKAVSDLATANTALAGTLRSPSGVRPMTPLFVLSRSLPPVSTFAATALSSHPQIARLAALEDQADAGVELQRAKLRPQVFAFGQYNFDRRDALLTDPDWSFGIGLKYKLASGTGRRQMVDAARQGVQQAAAGVRETRTQLEIGVTKSWNDTEAARRRFVLLDSSVQSAQENLRLQILSFGEQQSTSLDVIDAQLGLGRSLVQRAQASYDYVLALAQLLNTSGQTSRMADYAGRVDKVIP